MKQRYLPLTSAKGRFPDRTYRMRSREKPLSATKTTSRDVIDTSELAKVVTRYSAYCRAAGFSPRTIETREATYQRLEKHLLANGIVICGEAELIAFAGGLRNNLNGEELRPWTARTIHAHLRALFNWAVDQGILDVSPHARVPVPILRKDQKVPHTAREIELVLRACKESYYPRRNTAIVHLLIDTGIRATELCNLTFGDLRMAERSITVLGKGNKRRDLNFGVKTSRALWSYLGGREYREGQSDSEALFLNEEGKNQGMAMTRRGLLTLILRLGLSVSVKSHPHRLRHTFAVNYILNGGDAFTLMLLLGHTDMQTSNGYVLIANANLAAKYEQCSPMDNMDC